MVNYRDIAMGKPSTEDLTNDFDADPFKQRVSLDQNTRQSKFNQEILQYPLNAGNDGGRTPAGHHIQFEILEQDVGTIKFGELPKETTDEVVGISSLISNSSVARDVVVSKNGSVFTLVPALTQKGQSANLSANTSRAAQQLGLNPFISGTAEVKRVFVLEGLIEIIDLASNGLKLKIAAVCKRVSTPSNPLSRDLSSAKSA